MGNKCEILFKVFVVVSQSACLRNTGAAMQVQQNRVITVGTPYHHKPGLPFSMMDFDSAMFFPRQ